MPGLYHQGREYLSAADIERIYQVTDTLEIHRDWVVVPMDVSPQPRELLHPDGKLLIHAPGEDLFEAWLERLHDRLLELDLGRAPRRGVNDPKFSLTGPGEIRLEGTRTYLRRSRAPGPR